ncbi:MAG: hypothetical protein KTR31_38505 [Myxococcales bacterium]|nr:hypothetical protein [Myxococcales bacterium]
MEVRFDRPFDRHLSGPAIRIVAKDRQVVAGTPQVGDGERVWRFTPDEAWADGDLLLVVHSALEDVAGNNFRDLLDDVVRSEAHATSESVLPVRLRDCGAPR